MRKTRITLVDDLDGSDADETVVFSLDRVTYEIDLSKAHADRLRSGVAEFAAVARRVPRPSWADQAMGPPRIRRNSKRQHWPVGRPARLTAADTLRIREYASGQGILVHPRGRLPEHVVNAYYAHADTERGASSPNSVDTEKPSVARVYDYLLGGNYHWATDRAFAERMIRRFPFIKPMTVANRRWLGRVVNAALDAGITQFLDLGSGLPSPGAVHEIVRERTDQGRVVCVDNEPVAMGQWEIRLDEDGDLFEWMTVLREDLRNPEAILKDEETRELIDFTRPVCVLMAAVLHFVGGETDVPALIGQYQHAVAPGSWLAISHIANDATANQIEAAQVGHLVDSYKDTQTPMCLRTGPEIAAWFANWGDLLDPGLVDVPTWRVGTSDRRSAADFAGPFSWCGVAVKADGS